MFSTGMKNRWGNRIYLDLFAGPGHVVIKDHHVRNRKRRVLGSPLIALTVPDPFDRYIFCDSDATAIDALRTRVGRLQPTANVHFVADNINSAVASVASHIPLHSSRNTVLSLCVVDPYDLSIRFDTIASLGEARAMDFIILLATDMDGRRNWELYLDGANHRVDQFLGDPDWRSKWAVAEAQRKSPARFLAEQYAEAMAKIGYIKTPLDRMVPIKTYANNMQLYYLAFFSKSEKGYQFWDEVRKYSTEQTSFL